MILNKTLDKIHEDMSERRIFPGYIIKYYIEPSGYIPHINVSTDTSGDFYIDNLGIKKVKIVIENKKYVIIGNVQ